MRFYISRKLDCYYPDLDAIKTICFNQCNDFIISIPLTLDITDWKVPRDLAVGLVNTENWSFSMPNVKRETMTWTTVG